MVNTELTSLAIEGMLKQYQDAHESLPISMPFTIAEWHEILKALRPEGIATWRYVTAEHLPQGAPVVPGTRLYAFDGSNGHWEYDLPALPGKG